jgi:hypothetical protein
VGEPRFDDYFSSSSSQELEAVWQSRAVPSQGYDSIDEIIHLARSVSYLQYGYPYGA